MGVLVYASVWLVCLLLPLLSFLRSSATFRGGANTESFLYAGGTPLADRKARWCRVREVTLRLLCYTLYITPFTLTISRHLELRMEARQGPARPAPILFEAYQDRVRALASNVTGAVTVCALPCKACDVQERVPRQQTTCVQRALMGNCRRDGCNRLASIEPRLSWLRYLSLLFLDIVLLVPRLVRSAISLLDYLITTVFVWTPFLPSPRTFHVLNVLLNALYVRHHFLDRHEQDPQRRRHNTHCYNRFLNWWKHHVTRRVIWYLYHPLKKRFALELVPAYGPLPMFTFPARENAAILQAARHRGRSTHTASQAIACSELPSGVTAPAEGAANQHDRDGDSFSSEDKWDAEELQQLHLQKDNGHSLPSTAHGEGEKHSDTLCGEEGATQGAQEAVASPQSSNSGSPMMRQVTKTFASSPSRKRRDVKVLNVDDLCDRSASALSVRSSEDSPSNPPGLSVTAAPTPTYPSSRSALGGTAGGPPAPHRQENPLVSFTPTRSPVGEQGEGKEALPLKPALGCAQYFFAAHPHGILPACAVTALLSDFMGRDETLFIDNRAFPTAAETAAAMESAALGTTTRDGIPRGQQATKGSLNEPGKFPGTSTRFSKWFPSSPLPTSLAQTSPATSSFTITSTRRLGTVKVPSSPALSPVSESLPTAPTMTTATTTAEKLSPQQFPIVSPSSPTSQAREELYDTFGYYMSDEKRGNPAAERSAHTQIPPRYAKAKHYMYSMAEERFILQPDCDEARPPAGFQQNTSPFPRLNYFTTRIRAVVASFPFYLPWMREAYMQAGLLDATYNTCRRVLAYNNRVFKDFINRYRYDSVEQQTKANTRASAEAATEREEEEEVGTPFQRRKSMYQSSDVEAEDDFTRETDSPRTFNMNHLLVFPGGASEALLSSSHGPTRLLLRRRRGFLRLALQMHSGLVPVFTFGETDYYDQYGTTSSRFAASMEDDEDSMYGHAGSENGDDSGVSYTSARNEDHDRSTATATNSDRGAPSGAVTPQKGGRANHRGEDPTQGGKLSGFRPRGRFSLATDELNYYAQAIPSSTDDESSVCTPSASASLSPVSLSHGSALCLSPQTPEQQMLVDDMARARHAYRERQQAAATAGHSSSSSSSCCIPAIPVEDAEKKSHDETIASGNRRNTGSKATATEAPESTAGARLSSSSPASRKKRTSRLPKWLQAVQVLVQQTFGISLPILKNLVPKSGVKAMTVVGRPLFFALPPELERMYTNPEANYDKELERPILAAAQEVYIEELTDLFNRYAPVYYSDRSRRKLIII